MNTMSEDCHTETCSFCDAPTGPWDYDSMADGHGIYCGRCVRRMGLAGELILPCGLCRFPVVGRVYMIHEPGHDCEYCESCYTLLRRAGF